MNYLEYGFLYYLTHGFSREEIKKWIDVSDEEYEQLLLRLQPELALIGRKRKRAAHIGEEFMFLTRHMFVGQHDFLAGLPRPPAIKAPAGELIPLPQPEYAKMPDMRLKLAIRQRRSLRNYADGPITREELSFLLWVSFQVQKPKGSQDRKLWRRNVPSAGLCYPFECYLLANRVMGIAPGLYYYEPLEHGLILFDGSQDAADRVSDACNRQQMIKGSAATFLLCAVTNRCTWRFSQRGYRSLLIEAGHIGQNLYLAAEAISCGACAIHSFWDEGMNGCLGLDGRDEFVAYLISVGKKPRLQKP